MVIDNIFVAFYVISSIFQHRKARKKEEEEEEEEEILDFIHA